MVDISRINHLAVIGAGVQGYAIAQVALMAGFEKVTLHDINRGQLEKAAHLIENGAPRKGKSGKMVSFGLRALEEKGQLAPEISTDILLKRFVREPVLKNAVSNANFIIEAVPEVVELKQKVFKELGEISLPETILATNTSTISISRIAEHCRKPDKVMGMHFFAPINSRLIEIIKGKKTSDETMDIGEAIANKLPCTEGKRMVARLEKECPGFIGNRLNIVGEIYLSWVLEEAAVRGITYEQLDADIIDVVRTPVFLLMDILGIDTVVNSMKYFEIAVSKDFKPGKAFVEKIEKGALGFKTGKGFYDWSKGTPTIDRTKKAALLNIELILALQLNEGCRMLEEGIVKGYKTIDDVNLAGYGNPGPFVPGKKKYEAWSRLLDEFADKSGKEYARPCDLMRSGGFIAMRK